jgi:hypothetical protein
MDIIFGVEIKYDGTNQATLIHPKGETKIALFCGR